MTSEWGPSPADDAQEDLPLPTNSFGIGTEDSGSCSPMCVISPDVPLLTSEAVNAGNPNHLGGGAMAGARATALKLNGRHYEGSSVLAVWR